MGNQQRSQCPCAPLTSLLRVGGKPAKHPTDRLLRKRERERERESWTCERSEQAGSVFGGLERNFTQVASATSFAQGGRRRADRLFPDTVRVSFTSPLAKAPPGRPSKSRGPAVPQTCLKSTPTAELFIVTGQRVIYIHLLSRHFHPKQHTIEKTGSARGYRLRGPASVAIHLGFNGIFLFWKTKTLQDVIFPSTQPKQRHIIF